MLGDNPEKSKNPLKKAMRRRNAKTVQFAAPTYVEASDIDYSTDEDTDESNPYPNTTATTDTGKGTQQNGQQAAQQVEEPRAENTQKTSVGPAVAAAQTDNHKPKTSLESFRSSGSFEGAAALYGVAPIDQEPQTSPKLVDKTGNALSYSEGKGVTDSHDAEAAPLKSRKGTPRNTDSFLKDDSIETRKITLTPGLLREDSLEKSSMDDARKNSMDKNSLDSLTKSASPPEAEPKSRKEEKKKKEKKQGGMLSGLFKSKKKDKKSKADEKEIDEKDSTGTTSSRESPVQSTLTTSDRPSTADSNRSQSSSSLRQQAQKGRLTKPVPASTGPTTKDVSPVQGPATQPQAQAKQPSPQQTSQLQKTISPSAFAAELQGSEAPVEVAPPIEQEHNFPTGSKPKKVKRTKNRVELDDFDEDYPDPFSNEHDENGERAERLSDSPVEIISPTFMHGTENVHIPEPMMIMDSSDEEEDDEEDEEPESLTSSPSLVEHPEPHEVEQAEALAPPALAAQQPPEVAKTTTELLQEDTAPAPKAIVPDEPAIEPPYDEPTTQHTDPPTERNLSTSTAAPSETPSAAPTWNDDALRSWLDGHDNDVRDMLVRIHDPSELEPVSEDHPMMKGLFVQERQSVKGMMGELDGWLADWMQRKNIRIA